MKSPVWLYLLVTVWIVGPGSEAQSKAGDEPTLQTMKPVLDASARCSGNASAPNSADVPSAELKATPTSQAAYTSEIPADNSSAQNRTPLTGSITKNGHADSHPPTETKCLAGFGQLYGSEDDKTKWKFFTSVQKRKMSAPSVPT